jgi:coenzyme F420-reducing hydrogenase gamma subunit
MVGSLADKLKVLFLGLVIGVLALSAFPRGMSYFQQANPADATFKPNYAVCDPLKDDTTRFETCRGLVDRAAAKSSETCAGYANKVEECQARQVNCRAHRSNLNACKVAVYTSFLKQLPAAEQTVSALGKS